MPLVVPVKFTYASRDLWFDPQDLDILEADYAICSTERGIPCSKAAISILDEKGIGDSFVKEANAKVLGYSQFSQDPQFDNSELKANPDGLYYKVFGTLSSGDITPEEGAKNLCEGITEILEQ